MPKAVARTIMAMVAGAVGGAAVGSFAGDEEAERRFAANKDEKARIIKSHILKGAGIGAFAPGILLTIGHMFVRDVRKIRR